ncbi:MAG: CoA transferase [Thermodesulfobacteriota bacterium]
MSPDGPLKGVRVLDFTHVLGGPFTTMLLGDLGAEVVKIEPPGRGDSTRLSGPPFQKGESAYFMCVNRNKKSICVDLKKEEGRELIRRMVKHFDVVVESFRPRVMVKLGLHYEEMKKIKPDLIYASLSAFGSQGPYREKPGFEFIVQSLTGLVSVTTEPGRPPSKIQIQVVDLCAGMFLTLAVLGALYHRKGTGQGQKVEVSLLESTVAMLANLAGIYFMTGKVPLGMRTRNPQVMPSQAFRTKDSYVALVTQPQHWEKFCQALDKPEWINDPDLSSGAYRVAHYDEVEALIEGVISTRSTGEWLERFEKYEIAAGPINTVEEFFQHPLVEALRLVHTVEHPRAGQVKLLRQPWNLTTTPGGVRLPPPVLGQHTFEVLAEMGLSHGQQESLKRKGVIYGVEKDPSRR